MKKVSFYILVLMIIMSNATALFSEEAQETTSQNLNVLECDDFQSIVSDYLKKVALDGRILIRFHYDYELLFSGINRENYDYIYSSLEKLADTNSQITLQNSEKEHQITSTDLAYSYFLHIFLFTTNRSILRSNSTFEIDFHLKDPSDQFIDKINFSFSRVKCESPITKNEIYYLNRIQTERQDVDFWENSAHFSALTAFLAFGLANRGCSDNDGDCEDRYRSSGKVFFGGVLISAIMMGISKYQVVSSIEDYEQYLVKKRNRMFMSSDQSSLRIGYELSF